MSPTSVISGSNLAVVIVLVTLRPRSVALPRPASWRPLYRVLVAMTLTFGLLRGVSRLPAPELIFFICFLYISFPCARRFVHSAIRSHVWPSSIPPPSTSTLLCQPSQSTIFLSSRPPHRYPRRRLNILHREIAMPPLSLPNAPSASRQSTSRLPTNSMF
ncbi:hypothetical protein BDZ97DRAFT_102890 [Flammula alnicola]|nr:hypothetical protein BDZ97DRAFT_102890 [Flammula alnicola]